jgi:hypothetical protein
MGKWKCNKNGEKMATPKIKIYRLFPGYSSLNDNDIQESVND